jgi:transposase
LPFVKLSEVDRMAKQSSAAAVQLSPSERETLEGLTRRRKTASGMAQRATIVLCAATGESNLTIARKLGINRLTVGKWRARFSERRLDGLYDEPRPGAPRKILDKDVERVVTMTIERAPKASTHWSTRTMAKQCGLSQTTISRIWRAFGLKPHRQENFKLSTDPLFVDKVRDIVGLYMNPPDRAVVLCVDEKSQMQALDRTQPLLPMCPGQVERRTHDYVRHGTSTLFAALDVKAGSVIGACYRRHRAREFKRFLGEIDANVPQHLEVHVVLDNASTHKTPAIQRWLLKHPRYHLHFTPTSASWMNQVERWFADLTERALRRGVHRSVDELERAVLAYIDASNADTRPFSWTKTADQIFESLAAVCRRTSNSGH